MTRQSKISLWDHGAKYHFPEKSELVKFPTSDENWFILFCGFRGGNKIFAEIRAGFHLVASLLNSAVAATLCTLVLQHDPACRLLISLFSVQFHKHSSSHLRTFTTPLLKL